MPRRVRIYVGGDVQYGAELDGQGLDVGDEQSEKQERHQDLGNMSNLVRRLLKYLFESSEATRSTVEGHCKSDLQVGRAESATVHRLH